MTNGIYMLSRASSIRLLIHNSGRIGVKSIIEDISVDQTFGNYMAKNPPHLEGKWATSI